MTLKLKMKDVTWFIDSGTSPEQKDYKIFVSLQTKDDFGHFMLTEPEFDHIMKMTSKIKTIEELKSAVEEIRNGCKDIYSKKGARLAPETKGQTPQ